MKSLNQGFLTELQGQARALPPRKVTSPSEAAPVRNTDPRDQLGIHTHSLPQTTDKSEDVNPADSNDDSNNSSGHRQPAATGDSA